MTGIFILYYTVLLEFLDLLVYNTCNQVHLYILVMQYF